LATTLSSCSMPAYASADHQQYKAQLLAPVAPRSAHFKLSIWPSLCPTHLTCIFLG